MAEGTRLDWATAEALAVGSLLAQGKTLLFGRAAGRERPMSPLSRVVAADFYFLFFSSKLLL